MKQLLTQPHAILSVENPRGPVKRAVSHEVARAMLDKLNPGSVHSVAGHYGSPERSILVSNPNQQQMDAVRKLAHDTGQESHIESDGMSHKMLFGHGPEAGKIIQGKGTQFHADKPADMYSTLPSGEHFTHNFDFPGASEEVSKAEKPFHGYNKEKHARTGGLNDKERKRINREEGRDLKRPQPEGGARKKSFCARMSGVKGPTSKDGKLTPKGAALKRWKCSKSEELEKARVDSGLTDAEKLKARTERKQEFNDGMRPRPGMNLPHNHPDAAVHWGQNAAGKHAKWQRAAHAKAIDGLNAIQPNLPKDKVKRTKKSENTAESLEKSKEDVFERWQSLGGGENAEAWALRDSIPKMEGKKRADALAAMGEFKRHPVTKERMFLLHRGMSGTEHKNSVKGRKINHPHSTSWSQNFRAAAPFSQKLDDQGHIVSAWIPESSIRSIPSHASKRKFRDEKEVIVEPNHNSEIHDSISNDQFWKDNPDFGKSEDPIEIPKKAFVAEHKKLLDVLEHPTKAKLKDEAKEQNTELKEQIKKSVNPKLLSKIPTHTHPKYGKVKSLKSYETNKGLAHTLEIMEGEHKGKWTSAYESELSPEAGNLEKSKNVREQRAKVFGTDPNAPRTSERRMKMMQRLKAYAEKKYGIPATIASGKRDASGQVKDVGYQKPYDVFTPKGIAAEKRYSAQLKDRGEKRVDAKPDWRSGKLETQPSPDAFVHEISHLDLAPEGMTAPEFQTHMDKLWGESQSKYGHMQQKRTQGEIQPMSVENPIRREVGLPANRATKPVKQQEFALDDPSQPRFVEGKDSKGKTAFYDRQSRLQSPATQERRQQIQEGSLKFHPETGWFRADDANALVNLRGRGQKEEAMNRLKEKVSRTQPKKMAASEMEKGIEHAASPGVFAMSESGKREAEDELNLEPMVKPGAPEDCDCDLDKQELGPNCSAKPMEKRCWTGYEPVPGKAPYSKGSCRPKKGT